MGWWENLKEKVQEYEEAGKEKLQEGQDYLVKEYEQGKEYVEEKKQEINAALKKFDDSRAQQAQSETPTVIGAAHVPIDSEGRDHEFNNNVKEGVAAAAAAVDRQQPAFEILTKHGRSKRRAKRRQ